jgi:hypothetical protein
MTMADEKEKDLTQEGRKPDDTPKPQDPMADHPGGDVDSEPTGAGPSGGADTTTTTTTGDSEPTGSGPSGGA